MTHRREDNNRVQFLTEEEEKRLQKVIEAKWPLHLHELDLATNTGLRKRSQYSLAWDMVDFRGLMLNVPRTKNEEPIHVPLNDATDAALRVVDNRGEGRGRVFQSEKTGGRSKMGGAQVEDIADLLGHKSLTMTRRYAHLGPNKLHAVVSLLRPSDTTSDTSPNDASSSSSQVVVK